MCEEEFAFTLRREEPFSAELDPLPGALCRTEETDIAVSVFSPAQASLFSVFAPLVDQDTLWFIPQSTVGEHHRFVSKRPLQGFETGQDLVVYVTLGGCALTLSPKIATCSTAQNAGYFPNAFSPNNDGYNDTYQITLAPHHHLRALEIFDRR